jgi:endo-alpha-1,4-polygalactosaminidase (GH114 family)
MWRGWWWVLLAGFGVLAACSSDDGDSGGTATGGAAGGGSGGTGAATSGGGTSSSGGSAGIASGGSAGTTSGGSGGSTSVWQPKPGTSWQWQLSGSIDTSVDVAMYDIDLVEAPQTVIDELHAKGRIVICYFSAGSREDWRPDAGDFSSSDYGKGLQGWPGETWLDIRSANVRAIMKKRLDLAVQKSCDGVEPDNVDGYANDTGFPLTEADQLDYLSFLSTEAHGRGLSVGLKNSVELVSKVVGSFDWALNEECLTYSECSSLAPFISAGKAVFHVEYVDQTSDGAAKKASVCGDSSISGFSTLIKTWDLDAWRLAC